MIHTRFPKEDHLPEWARRDNQVKKGDRVDYLRTCIISRSSIKYVRMEISEIRQIM